MASRPAARRGGGVSRREAISRVLVEPEPWEGIRSPKDQLPHHFTHKSWQVCCLPGSPPGKAGIMARSKDYAAPSDNDVTAYQACSGPCGPSGHPLPMSDCVSSRLARETQ